jgi:hypothetical protein
MEEKLFWYWKEKLGLSDWVIEFKYNMNPEDMAIADAVGCASWEESSKTGLVEIMDPAHYGERVVPFDLEKTIVHELLHIKTTFISSDCGKTKKRIAHQLIDDLAKAFVDARRDHEIEGEDL